MSRQLARENDLQSGQRGLRLTNIGIADGLSQSTVNCILEDKRGIKWFGTQNGLNRYDGHSFLLYTHSEDCNNSLPSDTITDLHEDTRGILWIGTSRGISRFEPLTETFENYSVEAYGENSISNSLVTCICQDRDDDGLLWLGSTNGLCLMNMRTNSLEAPQSASSPALDHVTKLCDDGSGSLWIGTYRDGLHQLCKTTGKISRVSSGKLRITAIRQTSSDELLVGTEKQGLYSLVISSQSLTTYDDKYLQESLNDAIITALGYDQTGRLWIGTHDRGISIHCPETGSILSLKHDRYDPESLLSNWVRTISCDIRERVWIGTLTGGLSVYDPHKYKFQHIKGLPSNPASLQNNIVRCFREDRSGNLWVGTEGGLARYDEELAGFIPYTHDPGDPATISGNMVRGMYLDPRQRLWIFTMNGICYYNEVTNSFERFTIPGEAGLDIQASDLRLYYEDTVGCIWIGSEQGLVCYDPGRGTYELYDANPNNPNRIMGNRIRFVFEQQNGVIRVSAITGHSIIDRARGSVVNLSRDLNSTPLSQHFTLCMHEGSRYIWFGLMGGLVREDKETGQTRKYTVAHGLPNDIVYGILPDKHGRLWMSTNNGICCMEPSSELFRNYGVSDGLQSTEFNNSAHYKARNGEMFFGGVNGFNRFYPEDIHDDNEDIPLVFIKFHISTQDVACPFLIQENGLLSIPYLAKTFGFEFVGLEYSHPGKIRYTYKLEGFDDDWVQCGVIKTAFYNNVPAGEYIFRVKSTNKDRVWCNNEISIVVKVEQPQWLHTLSPGFVSYDHSSELAEYLEEMQSQNVELQAKNRALESYNQRLIDSAYHDALTGVYNRAGYKHYLELYSQRSYQPLGLVVIDVDGLKMTNDNLGHEAGDRLIQSAASTLLSAERPAESIVARIGGDEFVVLVANSNEAELKNMCDTLILKQEELNRANPEDLLSISYGYALSTEVSLEQLFSAADEVMYNYKRMHGEEARRRVMDYIARHKEVSP